MTFEFACLDWLNLYIDRERSSGSVDLSIAIPTTCFSLESVPDCIDVGVRGMYYFDVDSLSLGEKRVLSKPADANLDGGTGIEMNIVLTYRQRNPIVMRCTWHDTETNK
jgi:hypothetical protein